MTAGLRWLVDKSALRMHRPAFAAALAPRIAAGRVGVCIVTELEIGFSARSSDDHQRTRRDLVDLLLPVMVSPRAEQRARELQAALVERGQHRAVAVPDLLVAAVALVEGLVVLHHDGDFDLIADLTGQPSEWLVPSDTI